MKQLETDSMNAAETLFPNFRSVEVETSGARLSAVVGGAGAPVLLLHGYPQTKAAWHRVAGPLAEKFTVIAPDLPGYGDSRVIDPPQDWGSKRWMGAQLHELMMSLGYQNYAVVGHDRGGRVGYRMALDFPDCVRAFASLAVVPTSEMWRGADKNFGMGAFHWYMLAQPHDLPERLLSGDPDYFLDLTLEKMSGGLERLHPVALAEYRRAFREPSVRHAMCEDYRSGAGSDERLDLDDRSRGRTLAQPVLVLWEEGRTFGGGRTPIDIWRQWAADVSGRGLAGGHLLAENAAADVLADLIPFLERN